MKRIKKLCPEIKGTGETLSKYRIWLNGWGFTGREPFPLLCYYSVWLYFFLILLEIFFFFWSGAMFTTMFSEIYGKVVVASKVPLPNYRPDLDDKRPQREVRNYFFLMFFYDLHL